MTLLDFIHNYAILLSCSIIYFFIILLSIPVLYTEFKNNKISLNISSNEKQQLKIYYISSLIIFGLILSTVLLNCISLSFFKDNIFLSIFIVTTTSIVYVLVCLCFVRLFENSIKNYRNLIISFPIWLFNFLFFIISLHVLIQIIWNLFINVLNLPIKIDNYFDLAAVFMTFLFAIITAISFKIAQKTLNFEKNTRLNEKIQFNIQLEQNRLNNLYVPLFERTEKLQKECSSIPRTFSLSDSSSMDEIVNMGVNIKKSEDELAAAFALMNSEIKSYVLRYKHLSENRDLLELIKEKYGVEFKASTLNEFLKALEKEINIIHENIASLNKSLISEGID